MKMPSLKNGLIVGAGLMVFTLVGTLMNNGRSADAARAADVGPGLVLVNEQVLAYFESGEIPFIRVAWNSPTTNTGAFQAVISGYLVDLNP